MALPADAVFAICGHLDRRAILNLSEVNKHFNATLSKVRQLLLKNRFHNLRLSDWKTWREYGEKCPSGGSTAQFAKISAPIHIDEPLPANFVALQGGVQRKAMDWVACDRGMYLPKTKQFLDLRDGSQSGTVPFEDPNNLKDFVYAHVTGGGRQDSNYSRTTSARMVRYSTGKVVLIVSYKDKKNSPQIFDMDFDKSDEGTYCCYVVDDQVFYFFITAEEVATNGSLSRGGKPITIDTKGSLAYTYGYLIYNGVVSKMMFDGSMGVNVISANAKDENNFVIRPPLSVCQDDKFPEWGMAHSDYGYCRAVVDLKKRTMSMIKPDPQAVPIVGLVGGRLHVYTYSKKYLLAKCRDQGVIPLVPVIAKLLNDIENFCRPPPDFMELMQMMRGQNLR